MRSSTSMIMVSLFSLTLVSCASVPQQDQLMSGIDTSKISQGTLTKRAATDDVCVSFYNNVTEFQKQAAKSKGGQNFLTSMGVSVLAAVATQGIVPAGIGSTAGRVAAHTAASSVTAQGSRIAIRELNSSDRADAKIIETASQLGCPVAIKP